ncbi:unnamed protein product, partial [Taenia asiatica]|uniref:DOT1 domain-containing protein n=1 Tax=Taenia asiatica TaxID=60517 RepID=A0A0R3WBC8_TAEAS
NNSSVDTAVNAAAKPTENSSSLRLAVACAVGSIVTSVTYILVPFVSPAFRRICLPYVPATPKQLTLVAQLLWFAETCAHRRIGRLLDVGSGDGRVVRILQVLSLLADKRLTSLTTAAGVELNRPLVWWSRLVAWRQDHGDRASFHCLDLWTFDFSPFQSIVVFGVDTMVPRFFFLCFTLYSQNAIAHLLQVLFAFVFGVFIVTNICALHYTRTIPIFDADETISGVKTCHLLSSLCHLNA